ncbi:MAG: hypothetical protein HYY03_06630 [Chloroflexi bacterium]|nr:hypothetical protein [Chloroflexota bacterium]
MAISRKTRSKIPRFKTREEEAQFWDTHSTTEFEDEFTEVKLKVARPLIHTLAVRMDARTIDRLAAVGRKKGIGPSTLARMWLLERLDQEAEG